MMVGRIALNALSVGVFLISAALLGACASQNPREAFPEAFTAMAPEGSTPEQVRGFCTDLGISIAQRAYAASEAAPNRQSLAARIFSSCMERHNLNS